MDHEQLGTLRASATNFGMDQNQIADILQKFGPDVPALVTEAARNGFSVEWVTSTLNQFGPSVLQFLVNLSNKHSAMGVAPSGDLTALDPVFIQTLLNQILPLIMKQYGPQIIQGIITVITNALKTSGSGAVPINLDTSTIQQILTQLLQQFGPQLIQMIINAIINAITPTPAPTPAPGPNDPRPAVIL